MFHRREQAPLQSVFFSPLLEIVLQFVPHYVVVYISDIQCGKRKTGRR